MRMMKHGVALGVCVLLLGGGSAYATQFDDTMGAVLGEYLKIQSALALDTTEGIGPAAKAIGRLAKDLKPQGAVGTHAAHYENIPQDLLKACQKMSKAESIKSAREAFKDLSKPVSMWVSMAKPEGKSVMYCPMVKTGWVQEGSETRNPYFGAKMSRCGKKVGGGE